MGIIAGAPNFLDTGRGGFTVSIPGANGVIIGAENFLETGSCSFTASGA
jgi:hypothetical protein